MKKFILFILVFVSVEILYGQGFQVGIKAGTERWFWLNAITNETPNKLQHNNGNSFWTKELFIRSEHKRWAFENNLKHYSYQQSTSNYVVSYDVDIHANYYFHSALFTNNYDVSTTSQYLVFGTEKSKLKNYVGLSAGLQYAFTKVGEDIIYEESKFEPDSNVHHVYTVKTIHFYIGLNNYISYCIDNKLKINLLTSFNLNPISVFSSSDVYAFRYTTRNDINSRLGISIGMSYQFK